MSDLDLLTLDDIAALYKVGRWQARFLDTSRIKHLRRYRNGCHLAAP